MAAWQNKGMIFQPTKSRDKTLAAVWLVVCFGLADVTNGELPALSVLGKDVVTQDGAVVSMRGTNFGGWLMMESWIPSIEMEWHDHLPRLAREVGIEAELQAAIHEIGDFDDDVQRIQEYLDSLHEELKQRAPQPLYHRYIDLFQQEPPVYAAQDMHELLGRRFGDAGAAEIWNAFHDRWITEVDFQLARALGFNFVRLPFWYRWLEDPNDRSQPNEYGYRYLDRAIAWAKEHGLYVMLDFHGAVGGQSPWDHTGELSRGELFENREFQERTCRVWQQLAARYKDEPTVWAYDALNEPYSAKDVERWSQVHDSIYRAIRAVDPGKIIVMEDGYKLEEQPWKDDGFFPLPADMGWRQVAYSFHFYSGGDPLFTDDHGAADHGARADEVMHVGLREQRRCNVPIYIGEFSTMNDHANDIDGMRIFLTRFNEAGWHWSPWTFKYVDDDNEGTIWGIYQYNRPWSGTPNMHRDSKESILSVIDRYAMDNFSLQEPYAQVLRAALVQPVRSAEHNDSESSRGQRVRVASISFRPVKLDLAGNADRLEHWFRKAAAGGAKLAVAPEGILDGYAVNEIIAGEVPAARLREVALTIDSPMIGRFQKLANELDLCLVFGFAERVGDDLFNCAVFIDNVGEICGKYHKMQFAEGYDDSWWFNRLGAQSRAFDTPLGRCGVMICNDRWNPQLAQIPALDGAQFLVIPSFGSTSRKQDEAVLARGVENDLPIVEANVGVSLIVSDNRVAALNREVEGITFGEIDIPPRSTVDPSQRDRVERAFLNWRKTEMQRRLKKRLSDIGKESAKFEPPAQR